MSMPTLEVHINAGDLAEALREDVWTGLRAEPKWLSPKWFYDGRGSELFDDITRLPEYYPTRAERAILAERAAQIAGLTGAVTFVELGSGSSDKTRLLLDAFAARGGLETFVPLDVSESALRQSTRELADTFPDLRLHGVVGDFTRHLDALPKEGPRLVALLGGTIGNLLPTERAEFLAGVRGVLEPGEWFLLGTDLVKDPGVLVPAYDDAAGVTADFNRNVLRVINRELGADFDVDSFEHVAIWDADREWIEMRLRAGRASEVRVAALDLTVPFAAGEDLRTEISAKFRPAGVAQELAEAGFRTRRWWTDPDGRFGVSLAEAH
jgi:L-histidine N-alpha-methyltransferase